MKKLILATTVVAMLTLTLGVSAEETVLEEPVTAQVNFIDEDGDGVCDLLGENGHGNGQGFVDEDGDGLCDLTGEPVGSQAHAYGGRQGDEDWQGGRGNSETAERATRGGRSEGRGAKGARLQDGSGDNEDCLLD